MNATAIEDVIVTARRREERIIDVPLSVSAFSQEQLEDLKIEGGAELLRAIPNVSFSKDNFTGYNFSIRGIGTKVLSSDRRPGCRHQLQQYRSSAQPVVRAGIF